MRARHGTPKAIITATAHKLARIVYHLLKTGKTYDETVFADQEILNYQHYDLILTCLPMFQEQLEKHGVHTSLFYHGAGNFCSVIFF